MSTRSVDIDDAVRKLHSAICQIDSTPRQRAALKNLLNSNVRDLLSEFGKIEELRYKFDGD